jgi:hypothetical protein
MKICNCEEDLVCINCIYREASEDYSGFSLCNLKNETMGKHTRDDSFCGEGNWALKTTVENWHYDKGNRTIDTPTNRIKVIDREYAIAVLMNEGILDW